MVLCWCLRRLLLLLLLLLLLMLLLLLLLCRSRHFGRERLLVIGLFGARVDTDGHVARRRRF